MDNRFEEFIEVLDRILATHGAEVICIDREHPIGKNIDERFSAFQANRGVTIHKFIRACTEAELGWADPEKELPKNPHPWPEKIAGTGEVQVRECHRDRPTYNQAQQDMLKAGFTGFRSLADELKEVKE